MTEKLTDVIFAPKEIRALAPTGFKSAYERVAKDPASTVILSDILALVGYDAAPEVIATWSLVWRVQAEVWAANEHGRASDNILRRHPKPEWLPEPWKGPRTEDFFAGSPTLLKGVELTKTDEPSFHGSGGVD